MSTKGVRTVKLDDVIIEATPGPWGLGKGTKTIRREDAPGWQRFVANTHQRGLTRPTEEADARFIATFDPEHVRLMDDVCRAAERKRQEILGQQSLYGVSTKLDAYRNEHALVCAATALDAYRRKRGLE